MEFGIFNLALAVWAGLASVLSPCVLPVVPIVMAGAQRDDRLRPLFLVAGLSFTFILMGVLSSLFGYLLVGRMRHIEQAGGAVIALAGLLLLLDVNLFKRMHRLSNLRVKDGGRFSAVILGMALGVIWVPCIGPVLSGILAMVGTSGEVTKGVVFLALYSAGFALPMLALGYSTQLAQKSIRALGANEKAVRMVTGGILLAFGLYIVLKGNFAYLG